MRGGDVAMDETASLAAMELRTGTADDDEKGREPDDDSRETEDAGLDIFFLLRGVLLRWTLRASEKEGGGKDRRLARMGQKRGWERGWGILFGWGLGGMLGGLLHEA